MEPKCPRCGENCSRCLCGAPKLFIKEAYRKLRDGAEAQVKTDEKSPAGRWVECKVVDSILLQEEPP